MLPLWHGCSQQFPLGAVGTEWGFFCPWTPLQQHKVSAAFPLVFPPQENHITEHQSPVFRATKSPVLQLIFATENKTIFSPQPTDLPSPSAKPDLESVYKSSWYSQEYGAVKQQFVLNAFWFSNQFYLESNPVSLIKQSPGSTVAVCWIKQR